MVIGVFMQTENSVGLVVGIADYKENDKLITLCTLEKGKITAVLKGCKKPKAKLKLAASLLCFGEFWLTDGKFKTVTDFKCLESFFEISSSLNKFYLASALAETLKTFMKENDIHKDAVIETVNCLKELVSNDEHEEKIFLISFIKLLNIFGYGFEIEKCAVCKTSPEFFSFENGFLCNAHKSGVGENISSEGLKLLREVKEGVIGQGDYEKKTYYEIFYILRHYYYFCSEKPNKSLKTYSSLFLKEI